MLNKKAKDLYLKRNISEVLDNVEVIFLARDYHHSPKDGISYNIEKYNIKNHTRNRGSIIHVATHWNPPQIIDYCFYGYLR